MRRASRGDAGASIAQAFGTLVASMEQTHGEMIDILGDLFHVP